MKGAIEQRSAWAIRAESLRAISRVASGEVSPDEFRAHYGLDALGVDTLEQARALIEAGNAPAAARGRQPLTTGGVAILSLRGMITPRGGLLSMLFGWGGGLAGFRRDLRDALNDADVGSILIDVDSPGGIVDLVPETAAEIRAARGEKPIVAISNTMAASAAYWIAAQADELVVTPSGDVGSIGVFIQHDEFSKMDAELGITTTLISAGKYKTEGNPFEPLTDEAKDAMQERVDGLYADFIADVAKGRGTSVGKVRSDFGEGRMVTAKNAVSVGMADKVATYEETVARLATGRVRPRRSSAEQPGGDAQAEQLAAIQKQNDLLEQQLAATEAAAAASAWVASAVPEPESVKDDDEQNPAAEEAEASSTEPEGDEPASEQLSAEDRRLIASVVFD